MVFLACNSYAYHLTIYIFQTNDKTHSHHALYEHRMMTFKEIELTTPPNPRFTNHYINRNKFENNFVINKFTVVSFKHELFVQDQFAIYYKCIDVSF